MDIKRDISNDEEATLTVEIPTEEVSEKFTDAFMTFQRQARIPGFRPGKVPMGLIRKRYGKDIMIEKAEELAREYLPEVFNQEDMKPGGQISLNLLEYGEDKPLRFEVKFPVLPEAKLSTYKGLRVMVNNAEVTDSDVEDQIEILRQKHAFTRSVDTPAPAEARLKLKIQEVDPSGLPLIGRKSEEKDFEFGGDDLGIGTDEQLLGIKAGDKRIIQVSQAGGITQAPHQQQIITPDRVYDETDRSEMDIFYSVEAVKVEIPELPPVDDSFAKKVNDRLSTFDELKEWTRFNLLAYVGATAQRQLEKGVVGRLIEENPFPISRAYIESTLGDVASESKVDDKDREKFIERHYRDAEFDMRWVLLRDAVAREENIEVETEEIDSEIVRIAEQTGDPVAKVRKRFEEKDTMDRLRSHFFEQKVIEFLMKNANVEKRDMSLKDFLSSSVPANNST